MFTITCIHIVGGHVFCISWFFCLIIHVLFQNRIFQRDQRDRRSIQPDATYASQVSWSVQFDHSWPYKAALVKLPHSHSDQMTNRWVGIVSLVHLVSQSSVSHDKDTTCKLINQILSNLPCLWTPLTLPFYTHSEALTLPGCFEVNKRNASRVSCIPTILNHSDT